MRILIHDYAGHPFQVQLSRALAARGHEVFHRYCSTIQTPQGPLEPQPDDPETFDIQGLSTGRDVQKYSFIKRLAQEREYAGLIEAEIERIEPDLVLSGNCQIPVQQRARKATQKRGAAFLFWLQDVLGVGAQRILSEKWGFVGSLAGNYYTWQEKRVLRASDGVILISEDHEPLMREWGVDPGQLHVIPNWAPLDDMPPGLKDNSWARKHGLEDKFCFLYSGTLGLKHNPERLIQLAKRFEDRDDVQIVVVSAGLGYDHIEERMDELGLDNILLLGFQPFEDLPDVLATGDVLIALLEEDAGIFSVPSKVLTYLCTARPLLLSVPPENLAARIVSKNDAGLTAPPAEADAFLEAAESLYEDDGRREKFAKNGRAYAEDTFDIETITDRFEQAFEAAIDRR